MKNIILGILLSIGLIGCGSSAPDKIIQVDILAHQYQVSENVSNSHIGHLEINGSTNVGDTLFITFSDVEIDESTTTTCELTGIVSENPKMVVFIDVVVISNDYQEECAEKFAGEVNITNFHLGDNILLYRVKNSILNEYSHIYNLKF